MGKTIYCFYLKVSGYSKDDRLYNLLVFDAKSPIETDDGTIVLHAFTDSKNKYNIFKKSRNLDVFYIIKKELEEKEMEQFLDDFGPAELGFYSLWTENDGRLENIDLLCTVAEHTNLKTFGKHYFLEYMDQIMYKSTVSSNTIYQLTPPFIMKILDRDFLYSIVDTEINAYEWDDDQSIQGYFLDEYEVFRLMYKELLL